MTTDVTRADRRPYFLWDEDITVAELRQRLREGSEADRQRLLGKMLREARDIDVWHFVTPEEVARELPALRRRLGRRWRFWDFLIRGWQADGILGTDELRD